MQLGSGPIRPRHGRRELGLAAAHWGRAGQRRPAENGPPICFAFGRQPCSQSLLPLPAFAEVPPVPRPLPPGRGLPGPGPRRHAAPCRDRATAAAVSLRRSGSRPRPASRWSRRRSSPATPARALADWLRSGAGRASPPGQRLEAVSVADAYSCRNRNRAAGGKLSEHAFGRAIDIGGFRLCDGTTVTVGDGWTSPRWSPVLRRIHDAGCGPFGTVLGPDANPLHADHLHLDSARRRSGPQNPPVTPAAVAQTPRSRCNLCVPAEMPWAPASSRFQSTISNFYGVSPSAIPTRSSAVQ